MAAFCRGMVTLSDLNEMLPIIQRNIQENESLFVQGRCPRSLALKWGSFSNEILGLEPFDYILGADVFFDPQGSSQINR